MMQKLTPHTTERIAFRILGVVTFCVLALLTKAYFDQQDELDKQQARLVKHDAAIAAAVVINCETNRRLISNIILRAAGSTYREYTVRPQAVLDNYRQQLLQIQLYRESPGLLNKVIARTIVTLEDSDPKKCKDVDVPIHP